MNFLEIARGTEDAILLLKELQGKLVNLDAAWRKVYHAEQHLQTELQSAMNTEFAPEGCAL